RRTFFCFWSFTGQWSSAATTVKSRVSHHAGPAPAAVESVCIDGIDSSCQSAKKPNAYGHRTAAPNCGLSQPPELGWNLCCNSPCNSSQLQCDVAFAPRGRN